MDMMMTVEKMTASNMMSDAITKELMSMWLIIVIDPSDGGMLELPIIVCACKYYYVSVTGRKQTVYHSK